MKFNTMLLLWLSLTLSTLGAKEITLQKGLDSYTDVADVTIDNDNGYKIKAGSNSSLMGYGNYHC